MAYNGGIIGPRNDPSFFSANGIWHTKQVSEYLKEARWYFNRSVTVNATAFTEADTIIITINTVGVPDGTNIYWSVTTLSGTTLTTAEFTDNILTGVCNIVNNTDNTTKKFRADRVPDGTRQMTVTFRTEHVQGPIIATTPVITLNDYLRGGDSVFDRAGWRFHKFTYSGWLYANKNVPVEGLIVAGGGGGGGNGGGGGGAGGLQWTNFTIPAGDRWVQVGGGGAWSGGGNNGSDGASSYIDGVIGCVGGGGGGSRDGGSAGRYGGSGGGGGGGNGRQAGGGGQPGQGNGGGTGIVAGAGEVQSAGGGGGGATGGGGNAAAKQGGNGGGGRGIDFVRDGTTENYAGGGGGGRTVFGNTGSDGVGQGANRGSGGHGESGGAAYRAGSNGDSGIVFIRYIIPT